MLDEIPINSFEKAYELHNLTGLSFVNGNVKAVKRNYRKILKYLEEYENE